MDIKKEDIEFINQLPSLIKKATIGCIFCADTEDQYFNIIITQRKMFDTWISIIAEDEFKFDKTHDNTRKMWWENKWLQVMWSL